MANIITAVLGIKIDDVKKLWIYFMFLVNFGSKVQKFYYVCLILHYSFSLVIVFVYNYDL